VYVPDAIVGSLIGPRGQNIKQMMKMTGAIIHIEGDRGEMYKRNRKEVKSLNNDDSGQKFSESDAKDCERDDVFKDSDIMLVKIDLNKEVKTGDIEKSTPDLPTAVPEADQTNQLTDEKTQPQSSTVVENNGNANGTLQNNPDSTSQPFRRNTDENGDRAVLVSGYDYQVYRAQSWIFQKVAENANQYPEEITLHCEAIVPTKVVGRIIGKGGQNVKYLQNQTRALVKIPDDEKNQSERNCAETPVLIVGNFYAVQAVQSHIGTMIADTEQKESKEYEGRRSSRNSTSKFPPGNNTKTSGFISSAPNSTQSNNKDDGDLSAATPVGLHSSNV